MTFEKISPTIIVLLLFVTLSCQGMAHTFLANQSKLDKVKESLAKGDKTYKVVYTELIKAANKHLKKKALTVTDKKQIPPSGDKHDYISMAPYWWADSLSENGLPYIRRDGEHNPEIYEFRDHSYYTTTCTNIFELSLAYYLSNEEKYAVKAIELLRIWFLNPETRMNPNLNYAQAIKGRNEGRGSGLIENRYIIYTVDAMELLKGSPALKKEDQNGMKKWLSELLLWMRESKNGVQEAKTKNNHGSWYDVQIVSLALATENKDIAISQSKRLFEKIISQITVEGRQPEELTRTNAYGYSFFNLEALCNYARLVANLDVDGWKFVSSEGKGIQKAIDFMYPYAINEKPWDYKQIGARKRDTPVRVMLYAYAAFGDKKYLEAAKAMNGGTLKDQFEMLYL